MEVDPDLATTLGARLSEADAKHLHEAIADVCETRSDLTTFAVGWDEPRTFFLRSGVTDADRAMRGVHAGVELLGVAPFKELLSVKELAFATEDAGALGKVNVARLTLGGTGKKQGPPPARLPSTPKPGVGIAWTHEGSSLVVVASEEPAAALERGCHPDKKLGDEPAVTRAVTPLGTNASTILVAQPLRFDARRANLPTSPLVVGVGRRDKLGFVRVDVSDGVLRELARGMIGM
jgi:hypothetical protein